MYISVYKHNLYRDGITHNGSGSGNELVATAGTTHPLRKSTGLQEGDSINIPTLGTTHTHYYWYVACVFLSSIPCRYIICNLISVGVLVYDHSRPKRYIAMQSAKLAEVDFVHVAATNLLEVEGGCDYRATQVPGWLHRHGGVSD